MKHINLLIDGGRYVELGNIYCKICLLANKLIQNPSLKKIYNKLPIYNKAQLMNSVNIKFIIIHFNLFFLTNELAYNHNIKFSL